MRYEAEEMRQKDTWTNALGWVKGTKLGQRYVKTKAEAVKVLNNAYQMWNGEKVYDSNGKRYETTQAGCIGVTTEHTRKTDHDLENVEHIIKKRVVTDWETVERSGDATEGK